MATHSSILAWRIPWTEEPGGLQSMGSRESEMTEGLTLSLSLLILPLSVLLISSHLDRFSLIYLFIHSLIHSSTNEGDSPADSVAKILSSQCRELSHPWSGN